MQRPAVRRWVGRAGFVAAAAASLALLAPGCADPEADFNDFEDRYYEQFPKASVPEGGIEAGDGGEAGVNPKCPLTPCTPPGDGEIDGQYLFGLSANIGKTLPFLFKTDVTVKDGKVTLVLQPLDRADRMTEVGDTITIGPIDISNGVFYSELDMVTLIGKANPLTGSDVLADVQVCGSMCGVETFYCGDMTGTVLEPLQGQSLMGSTFTLEKWDADQPTVVYSCDKVEASPPPT